MIRFLSAIILVLWVLAFSGVGYSSAALIREFKYQDGLLTIKGSQVPTLALLEKISESTSTVIYVFDPIYSQKVHVELEEKTLQDTLRNILRQAEIEVKEFLNHQS